MTTKQIRDEILKTTSDSVNHRVLYLVQYKAWVKSQIDLVYFVQEEIKKALQNETIYKSTHN
jgi:hypothetical protein